MLMSEAKGLAKRRLYLELLEMHYVDLTPGELDMMALLARDEQVLEHLQRVLVRGECDHNWETEESGGQDTHFCTKCGAKEGG